MADSRNVDPETGSSFNMPFHEASIRSCRGEAVGRIAFSVSAPSLAQRQSSSAHSAKFFAVVFWTSDGGNGEIATLDAGYPVSV